MPHYLDIPCGMCRTVLVSCWLSGRCTNGQRAAEHKIRPSACLQHGLERSLRRAGSLCRRYLSLAAEGNSCNYVVPPVVPIEPGEWLRLGHFWFNVEIVWAPGRTDDKVGEKTFWSQTYKNKWFDLAVEVYSFERNVVRWNMVAVIVLSQTKIYIF